LNSLKLTWIDHCVPLCATLYHFVQLWTTLYDVVPLCTTVYHFVQLCTALYNVVPLCTTLDHFGPLCTTLHHFVPLKNHFVPLCTTLYRFVPLCTTLYKLVPLCTTLYHWNSLEFTELTGFQYASLQLLKGKGKTSRGQKGKGKRSSQVIQANSHSTTRPRAHTHAPHGTTRNGSPQPLIFACVLKMVCMSSVLWKITGTVSSDLDKKKQNKYPGRGRVFGVWFQTMLQTKLAFPNILKPYPRLKIC